MGFLKSPGDLKLNHCRDITSAFQTSTALTTFIVVYLISSSMAVVTPPIGTQTSPSSSDENPFMMDDCKVWCSDTSHNTLLDIKQVYCQELHLERRGYSRTFFKCIADYSQAPDWFECHNKRCIVASWKCDDENDCMDWSDEDYFLCKVYSPPWNILTKLRCSLTLVFWSSMKYFESN